jgi:hypothetical protein
MNRRGAGGIIPGSWHEKQIAVPAGTTESQIRLISLVKQQTPAVSVADDHQSATCVQTQPLVSRLVSQDEILPGSEDQLAQFIREVG